MDDLVTGLDHAAPGPDGPAPGPGPDSQDRRARCSWGASTLDYAHYHDTEWGRATDDERTLYEKLCLEGFQSGLSWLTILRKREAFRDAFAGFDAEEVARFGPSDVERLLGDAGIVRHRGKIEATIGNARALVALWEGGRKLADLVWAHEPPRSAGPASLAEVPAVTAQSTALSKELRRAGFRFVGPTTAHAFMEAMGVVNDHLRGCWVRDDCETTRARLDRPAP
jgi:DNA-3-methyladenine glycosylase I